MEEFGAGDEVGDGSMIGERRSGEIDSVLELEDGGELVLELELGDELKMVSS